MHLHFLGGATTVTGSQFLLDTGRAKVLIDCGMFQGSPNEAVRNRVPFAFEPSELDAVVLTHAHLDHCGLLPVLVREGFSGPIHCTAGTAELARLVLLDSGKLHEQFAKREARWEKRNPDRVEADDRAETDAYQAAVTLASEGNALPSEATVMAVDAAGPAGATSDPEVALRVQPPAVEIDLDAPLYTQDDAEAVLPLFRPGDYGTELEVAPGVHATFLDAGHILGSAIIRLRVAAGSVTGRSGSSSCPATSAGPGRRSSATRRSSTPPTMSSSSPPTAVASTSHRTRPCASSPRPSAWSTRRTACC